MSKILLKLVFFTAIFNILFSLSSCSDETFVKEEPPVNDRLILIYAVAANNLQYNLTSDMREIIAAGPQLDLKNNIVLVYWVDMSGECKLQKLVKTAEGKYGYEDVTTFPDTPLSTSPERISEVMEYVDANFDYPHKGLVLWSHATGWLPWFDGNTPGDKKKSFGYDSYQGSVYKTNIDELAEAIPQGMFDFIWFDCCYMGNIETVYQLRDKTPAIVGSVLEIPADGMPYHLTMPYLLQSKANLQEAAYQYFTYYNNSGVAASISIIDTSGLPMLADVSSRIFSSGIAPASLTGIQNYSREKGHPFYDMQQLLDAYEDVDSDDLLLLDEMLQQVVTYKLISSYDFNHRPIMVQDYCGLSMHNYEDIDNNYEEFYTKLEWFEATRR